MVPYSASIYPVPLMLEIFEVVHSLSPSVSLQHSQLLNCSQKSDSLSHQIQDLEQPHLLLCELLHVHFGYCQEILAHDKSMELLLKEY